MSSGSSGMALPAYDSALCCLHRVPFSPSQLEYVDTFHGVSTDQLSRSSTDVCCYSAPGGTYQVAPPPLGTSADAGNQQRGGQGGVVTPTTTVTTTGNPVSEAPGPTATQSGIVPSCNNYAEAKSGDDCYDFAVAHSITPAQLYQYNSILGSNGANCSLMFQAEVSSASYKLSPLTR